VEKYGSRPVAMIGSFIAAVALFGGAFVNSVTLLYVVYGIAGECDTDNIKQATRLIY
jgi:hypothetical protein